MKILPQWLREFVDVPTDDRRLAADLTQAGINVEGFGTAPDGQPVWEVEITPNRVDAMNHYGIAREMSAIYDRDLRTLLHVETGHAPSPRNDAGQPAVVAFPIEIADPQGCARYTARVIRGVRIGASPASLAGRLTALESSAISNAVDASNYTLQEMGHPTHAFDLDLLGGGKIIVRRARKGEKLRTLDGVERALDPDDLVIADAAKPVALAGVMGGFDSMITERTRNVLIESAWFDPASVRRTARRHGLHTDASHRFERGADWAATPLACDRVAELILASAGDQLEGGLVDAVARRIEPKPIRLRPAEVLRHLGLSIPEPELARMLRRLGCAVGAALAVTPPTWRLDLEQEIDLIEEIARIYGYNRFPNTLPSFGGGVVELPNAARDARVRQTMLALGYHEAISLSFIAHANAEAFSRSQPVALANPVSDEAGTMRTSLVPGMLNMLAWNLNRGVASARLFECGHVFAATPDATEEHPELCLGATGHADPGWVDRKPREYGFFDLKGDVEQLLSEFQYDSLSFDAQDLPTYYHPGRSARALLDGAAVARFGELHPDVREARKLRQPVYLAEIFLPRLYEHGLRQLRYTHIPRFPAVERDFSFLFQDSIRVGQIREAIERLRTEGAVPIVRIQTAEYLDSEKLPGVPQGHHAVLERVTFQSPERTLRDDEVAAWSSQIVTALTALGGALRA